MLRRQYSENIYYLRHSKINFSSGELEDRGESATSECNSDSDFEREENQHIKSRILPTVLEIKNMVNEMREKQNERDTESLRSNFSNSTLSLNNLNQKVQESKRLSRNIQVLITRPPQDVDVLVLGRPNLFVQTNVPGRLRPGHRPKLYRKSSSKILVPSYNSSRPVLSSDVQSTRVQPLKPILGCI